MKTYIDKTGHFSKDAEHFELEAPVKSFKNVVSFKKNCSGLDDWTVFESYNSHFEFMCWGYEAVDYKRVFDDDNTRGLVIDYQFTACDKRPMSYEALLAFVNGYVDPRREKQEMRGHIFPVD